MLPSVLMEVVVIEDKPPPKTGWAAQESSSYHTWKAKLERGQKDEWERQLIREIKARVTDPHELSSSPE